MIVEAARGTNVAREGATVTDIDVDKCELVPNSQEKED